MQNSRRVTPRAHLAALCTLAVVGALNLAAAPVEPGNELWVRVWHNNELQADGAVWATSVEGGVKGVLEAGNYFSLANVGTNTITGLKTTLTTTHPVYGEASFDLHLNGNALTSVDVVYNDGGSAEYFSNDVVQQPSPPTGDGGPANDDCSGAIAVAVPSTTAGSTVGASIDLGGAACGTSITTAGVWYSVTGTGNQMTATTCGPTFGYDTKLTVYCNDCGLANCIVGNDDNCVGGASGLLSTVTWCSQAGATYLILVHGFGSATGSFNLSVSSGGSCGGAVECVPPEPTGACCFLDGSCAILTASECAAGGGDYQGDDSSCFTAGGSNNYAGTGGAIPDFGLGTFSNSVNVPSFTVGDVDVNLSVNHTWTGDLIVTLTHGVSVVVVDRPGVPLSAFGCSLDNWSAITLDDEGGPSIENACATNLVGTFTPASPLSAFDNGDAGGLWTLTVSDNAGADVGSVVSWSLDIAGVGDPICPPPECHLVIGDGQGSSLFFGSGHMFTTQVGPQVEANFPVLMENYPSFQLPAAPQRNGSTLVQLGGQGVNPNAGVPEWMLDGEFAVQVLMWNPGVFPGLPEQFTQGLQVQILDNGRVVTQPFGATVGGLGIQHEITTVNGKRYISFPFVIPGL